MATFQRHPSPPYRGRREVGVPSWLHRFRPHRRGARIPLNRAWGEVHHAVADRWLAAKTAAALRTVEQVDKLIAGAPFLAEGSFKVGTGIGLSGDWASRFLPPSVSRWTVFSLVGGVELYMPPLGHIRKRLLAVAGQGPGPDKPHQLLSWFVTAACPVGSVGGDTYTGLTRTLGFIVQWALARGWRDTPTDNGAKIGYEGLMASASCGYKEGLAKWASRGYYGSLQSFWPVAPIGGPLAVGPFFRVTAYHPEFKRLVGLAHKLLDPLARRVLPAEIATLRKVVHIGTTLVKGATHGLGRFAQRLNGVNGHPEKQAAAEDWVHPRKRPPEQEPNGSLAADEGTSGRNSAIPRDATLTPEELSGDLPEAVADRAKPKDPTGV